MLACLFVSFTFVLQYLCLNLGWKIHSRKFAFTLPRSKARSSFEKFARKCSQFNVIKMKKTFLRVFLFSTFKNFHDRIKYKKKQGKTTEGSFRKKKFSFE